MANRRIRKEFLDAASDEEASRNLSDLRRINRWLGGRMILHRILDRWYGPQDRFTVLDVGAASGDMATFMKKRFPNAVVISLDHQHRNLAAAPHPKLAGDAFHLPFSPRAFDIVYCSFLLHHFTNPEVATLLRAMHDVAGHALVAIDLERHSMARAFIPATRWLFRWDPVTVHDGPVSVEAAFKRRELFELALEAGLPRPLVRRHDPWFRLSLIAQK